MLKSFGVIVLFSLLSILACTNKQKKADGEKPETNQEFSDAEGTSFNEDNYNDGSNDVKNSGPLLSIDQLFDLLPNNIGAYVKVEKPVDDPLDSLLNYNSSVAIRYFVNEQKQELVIVLMDCKDEGGFFNEVMNNSIKEADVDNQISRSRRFSIQNEVIGQEIYIKSTKTCRIVAGVGQRFLVILEAEGQLNEDFTKEILLDELPIATLLDK